MDILNHSIKFDLKVINNGEGTFNTLQFDGVASYYFVEDSGEKRLYPIEPDTGDYTEVTTVQYYRDGIGRIGISSKSQSWVQQYFSSANFVLELWNSILLIEANAIIINDKRYELNYPDSK